MRTATYRRRRQLKRQARQARWVAFCKKWKEDGGTIGYFDRYYGDDFDSVLSVATKAHPIINEIKRKEWEPIEYEFKDWLPATFADVNAPPVYTCKLPYELQRKRTMDRLLDWRPRHDPIILHPDHYAWLQDELKGLHD